MGRDRHVVVGGRVVRRGGEETRLLLLSRVVGDVLDLLEDFLAGSSGMLELILDLGLHLLGRRVAAFGLLAAPLDDLLVVLADALDALLLGLAALLLSLVVALALLFEVALLGLIECLLPLLGASPPLLSNAGRHSSPPVKECLLPLLISTLELLLDVLK